MKVLSSVSGCDLSSDWLRALATLGKFMIVARLTHIPSVQPNVGSSEGIAARRARETFLMKLLITNLRDFCIYRLEASCTFWKPSVVA
jgi:hypothetical protein